MSDRKLHIVPLGGLGEFGMNSMAIRYGDDIIVVDAGMMFPDAELLGVDIVTPDFAYLEETSGAWSAALVLTHGHEDHIGGIPFLLSQLNLPIYGTAFTLALVERRLEEHELSKEARLHHGQAQRQDRARPFEIEFIHVTHSIVSAVALAITTPLGVIIHTGDFKVDPTPTDNELFDLHTLGRLRQARRAAADVAIRPTSTGPGTPRASAPSGRGSRISSTAPKRRLVISCFSSSIHRLQLILDLSHEFGRKVAFLGRSMNSVTEISHNLGLLTIPDGVLLRPQDVMTAPPAQGLRCRIRHAGRADVGAVARGRGQSQEPFGGTGRHRRASSRIIPGNEKAICRMMNHIARRGADIIYGNMNPPVHVSGHASAEELKLVLNLVRPRYFIPIHGEYRQMAKHASLAQHLLSAGPREDVRAGNRRNTGNRSKRRAHGAEGCRSAASASIRAVSTKLSRTSSSAIAAICRRMVS